AVRLHLPGEHAVGAVVVADGGDRRGVAVQRDRRQRPPLVLEAPDQLGGEVLRLRGAAAVAARQQPPAAAEDPRQGAAPRLDGGDLVAEPQRGLGEGLQPPVLRRGGPGAGGGDRHAATSLSAAACRYTSAVAAATRAHE